MTAYPKVRTVLPLDDYCLQVIFDNAVSKVYDCKPLLGKLVFAPLANRWLFRAVRVDPGGYGISWNDAIDRSRVRAVGTRPTAEGGSICRSAGVTWPYVPLLSCT